MTFDTAAVFAEEFERAIATDQAKSGFAPEDWSAAGYRPVQDRAWWSENGPGLVQNFIDWYESQPDINVWTAPDGRPAIELDLLVEFGGVPVRMAIDLVVLAGTALIVVDLKSGSYLPSVPTQLGMYACGLELMGWPRPRYGAYFSHRGKGKRGSEEKTYFQRPVELSGYQYSIEFYARQLEMLERGVQSGIFIANPGDHCDRCGVSRACLAVGGPEAREFDPAHPAFRLP